MTDWDDRWLALARHVGSWSKDRSTRVGCVIVGSANQVLSLGYNGFPRGVNDNLDERHERPAKYQWTEHAERNAIYNAARTGVSLKGAAMYLTLFTCTDCARAVIQAGITRLITPIPNFSDLQWGKDFMTAYQMLVEVDIIPHHPELRAINEGRRA